MSSLHGPKADRPVGFAVGGQKNEVLPVQGAGGQPVDDFGLCLELGEFAVFLADLGIKELQVEAPSFFR